MTGDGIALLIFSGWLIWRVAMWLVNLAHEDAHRGRHRHGQRAPNAFARRR